MTVIEVAGGSKFKDRTKTFGLQSPQDLYKKLMFDIERMRNAVGSNQLTYAAFDCAVAATHIADWVIHSVDEAAHLRLTGKPQGKEGAMKGFGQINASRIPGLEYCRQIANHSKHVEVTRGPQMEDMSATRSVRIQPTFDAKEPGKQYRASAFAWIIKSGKKYPAIELFEETAQQWKQFLIEEGLYEEEWESEG